MYARLVLYRASPGPSLRSRLERATAEVGQVMRRQRGFRAAYGVVDEASGEFGGISFWESREDAEAAGAALAAVVQETALEAAGPPTIRIFEAAEL